MEEVDGVEILLGEADPDLPEMSGLIDGKVFVLMDYLEVAGLAALLLRNELEFTIFVDPGCAAVLDAGL